MFYKVFSVLLIFVRMEVTLTPNWLTREGIYETGDCYLSTKSFPEEKTEIINPATSWYEAVSVQVDSVDHNEQFWENGLLKKLQRIPTTKKAMKTKK